MSDGSFEKCVREGEAASAPAAGASEMEGRSVVFHGGTLNMFKNPM